MANFHSKTRRGWREGLAGVSTVLGEDIRIKKVLGVVAVLVIFFAGFKYSEYRHDRVSSGSSGAEEVMIRDTADQASSQREEPEAIFVHIIGAVQQPGVYQMKEGDRVFQALEKAQPTDEADINRLNLAEPLVDGGKIYVPKVGEEIPGEMLGTAIIPGSGLSPLGAGKVNINTASVEELDQRLPGIGPALAQRIVDYRQKNGRFTKPEDIMEVSGIGEKRYEQIRDLITVR